MKNRLGILIGLAVSALYLFPPAENPQVKPAIELEPASSSPTPKIEKVKYSNMLAQLPLRFEKNMGQVAGEVAYYSHGNGYAFYLTPEESVMVLSRTLPEEKPSHPDEETESVIERSVVRMKLVGGNPNPAISGEDLLAGTSNYFHGEDTSRWRRGIPGYERVHYENVYPGIDLEYYGNEGKLEFDLTVKPGANPNQIELEFNGADSLFLDDKGNLVLETAVGRVIQKAPKIYQTIKGERRPVSGNYQLLAENRVSFQTGPYDTSRELIIDPILTYATFLGGSDEESWMSIDIDSDGNMYVTGKVDSTDFPTTAGSLQPNHVPSTSGLVSFITKINAAGNTLAYSTYISHVFIRDIEVDSSGNALVCGRVVDNLPLANAWDSTPNGDNDAFFLKLNATGNQILHSSYLGGSSGETCTHITQDSLGNIYLADTTHSTDFPTLNPLQSTLNGPSDVYVAKFNASANTLLYSTYLGGSEGEWFEGLAVDSQSNIYVAGFTRSANFPTANAFQTTNPSAGTEDTGFLTKIASNGGSLVYSTFLGGTNQDNVRDLWVDDSGQAYLTGRSWSGDFPLVNPIYPTKKSTGKSSPVLSKFDSSGNLIFSTFLGGETEDFGWGESVMTDSFDNMFVCGYTGQDLTFFSKKITSVNSPANSGEKGQFVAGFTPQGDQVLFSAILNIKGFTSSLGDPNPCTRDDFPSFYFVSEYNSTGNNNNPFLLTLGAVQSQPGGNGDAYVFKISGGVGFQDATSRALEGVGTANIPVRLDMPKTTSVTVDYAVTGGLAQGGGGDYTLANGTLTFSPGEFSKNIALTLNDDAEVEFDEGVEITLSNVSNSILGPVSKHVLVIEDNDTASPPPAIISESPSVISPYWQESSGVYSFISITHPSLDGMNSQIGLSVSAFLQDHSAYGSRATLTVDAGDTERIFLVPMNHPSINPTNFPQRASFIFGPPALIGVPSLGGNGYIRMDPVAGNPTQPLAGGGLPDIRMLSYWGAVVFEGTNTGFALEFIGDLNDSASHPGMTPGLFPSGVN